MFKATKIFIAAFLATLSVTQAALAEEIKLDADAILSHLNDKTYQQIKPVTQHIIKQTFEVQGVTNFFVNDQVQRGLWRIENEQYCSNWPPTDHWDCYDLLKDGTTLIFLSAQGARYVMVPSQL